MEDSGEDFQAELNEQNYKYEDEMEYDFEGEEEEKNMEKVDAKYKKQIINPEYLRIKPEKLNQFL